MKVYQPKDSTKNSASFCVWVNKENCKNFCLTDEINEKEIKEFNKPVIMDINSDNLDKLIDCIEEKEEVFFSLGKSEFKIKKESNIINIKKVLVS